MTTAANRQGKIGCGIVIGLALLIIAFASAGAGSSGKKKPSDLTAAERPSTPDATGWYLDSADLRRQIATGVAAVRGRITANDGTALKPACVALGVQVTVAGALHAAPAEAVQKLWQAGVGYYKDAVDWCGKLFDGTRIEVNVLLERTLNALGNGDARWAELARSLGQPVPTATSASSTPEGRHDPVRGRS